MNSYEKMFIAFGILVILYFIWFKWCINGAGEVDKDERDF